MRRQKRNVYVLFIVLFSSLCLFAKSVPLESTDEKNSETLEKQLIEGNVTISNWLDSVAEGLDLFLADKLVATEKSEARAKFRNTTFSTEGDNVTNSISFSINPRLRNFEKSIQIKFTTYESTDVNPLRPLPKEKNYGASVGLFKKMGQIKTSFQPRIEFQDPLKVSHLLSFESDLQHSEFQMNPRFDFYASATKGLGLYHALNFNFILDTDHNLTLINNADYQDKLHLYSVINGISLGQALSYKTSFTYSLMFDSNNRPAYHLEGYSALSHLEPSVVQKYFGLSAFTAFKFFKDQRI